MFMLLPIIGLPIFLVLYLRGPAIRDAKRDAQTVPLQPVHETSESTERADTTVRADLVVTDSMVGNDATPNTKQIALKGEPEKSVVDQLLAESQKKHDEAIASFETALRRVDTELLNQFGGDEWQQIQTLQQDAVKTSQPELAVRILSQAEAQLKQLAAQLPTRKAFASIRQLQTDGDHSGFLKALCTEPERYSGASDQFELMWQDVTTWNSSRWLELCQEEIKTMPPDDRAFAEIWHAMADYYRDTGDAAAQLEAEDKAWASLERMTDATRAAESALECLQRLPASTSSVRSTESITQTSVLISQIGNSFRRSALMAELSGIAGAGGDHAAADEYLEKSVAALGTNRSGFGAYLPDINRCRAMSKYAAPADILTVCAAIPKYNGSLGYDPFPANTLALSYAAVAAARTNEKNLWWKAVLLAESQQADAPDYGDENIVARATLAKADLATANWRRALISANNLSDPALRALIVYQIMLRAPNEVPFDMGLQLIQLRPTDSLAVPATARFVSHHATPESIREQLIPLVFRLKYNSARAAVFLALARSAAGLESRTSNVQELPSDPNPQLNDARSLIENAESSARILQLPIERAWANVWIAACWHRLNQPASYRKACDRVHDNLFSCWTSYWHTRQSDEDRISQNASRQLTEIVECYRTFAEIQAFVLNDSRNAVETCIDTARASQTLHSIKSDLRVQLQCVAEAVHQDCGISTDLLDSAYAPPNNYLRMIRAASQSNIAEVRKYLQRIETERPSSNFNKADCLARAYAEVAILSAKLGDVDSYRAARRQAVSLIQNQNATDSILIPLYEADAYAGEFELVMKAKRSRNRLPLYGTMSRPLSTLCVELSAAGRTDDVEPHLPAASDYYWRIRAMHGLAAGRLLKNPDADHLEWASSQEELIDRVAAYCGLALREPRLEKKLMSDAANPQQ